MNTPIAPNPECQYCGGTGIIEDKVIIGYMDKIDFDCEVGDNPNGNIFFTSIEDLQRERTCSEFCGIVEIEIRLKRVVQESKVDIKNIKIVN